MNFYLNLFFWLSLGGMICFCVAMFIKVLVDLNELLTVDKRLRVKNKIHFKPKRRYTIRVYGVSTGKMILKSNKVISIHYGDKFIYIKFIKHGLEAFEQYHIDTVYVFFS